MWPRWGTKQVPSHPVQAKTSCPPSCCGSRTSGETSLVLPYVPLFLCLPLCLYILLPVCSYFDCHHITHAPTLCRGRKIDSLYLRIIFRSLFCSLETVRAYSTALNHTILYYTALLYNSALYYTVGTLWNLNPSELVGSWELVDVAGQVRAS